jgi:hypothetical protein
MVSSKKREFDKKRHGSEWSNREIAKSIENIGDVLEAVVTRSVAQGKEYK